MERQDSFDQDQDDASVNFRLLSFNNSSVKGSSPPQPAPMKLNIHACDTNIYSFHGYYQPLWTKKVIHYLLGFITIGFTFLLERWFMTVRIALTLKPCPLHEAKYVLVTATDKKQDIVQVQRKASFTSIDIHAVAGGGGGGGPFSLGEEDVLTSLSDLHHHQPIYSPSTTPLNIKGDGMDRLIEYRYNRYLYSHAADAFIPIPPLPSNFARRLADMSDATSAPVHGPHLNDWGRMDRASLYGSNEIVIVVKSILELVAEEMVHPFYVFQYASVAIWCLQQYYSYSTIIVLITLCSILSTAIQAYRYRKKLAAMAYFSCDVDVIRSSSNTRSHGGELLVPPTNQPSTAAGVTISTIPSTELVPGDVILVKPGILPCDVVLLKGEAIVDETMLTGEAIPVRKVAYSSGSEGYHYNPDVHKGCTLYCGTTVAQVRPGGVDRRTVGVVARTSFWTAKGQLLRSILFPREHKMHFVSDAMRFIGAMLCLGLLFYIWDVIALASFGASGGFIIIKYLDMITIAVPPALPACLTVATAIAVSRLQTHGIFVSSPAAVTIAGHLDIVCFDKTGTLTEPGLELLGVVPVIRQERKCGPMKETLPTTSNSTNTVSDSERAADLLGATTTSPIAAAIPPLFQEMLATCHGLAQMGAEIVGDPLDQVMFSSTGWKMIDEGGSEPVEVTKMHNHHKQQYDHKSTSNAAGKTQSHGGGGGSPPLHFPLLDHAPSCLHSNRRSTSGNEMGLVGDSGSSTQLAHACTRICPPMNANNGLSGTYTVMRRFEFSSEKARNGVVVQKPDRTLHFFTKGSPEAISKLCSPDSLPLDFESELAKHTQLGLRVLGFAARQLIGATEGDVLSLSQDDFERKDLRFIGFAVLVNPLRPDTKSVIEQLHGADIRTVMVTGDHAKTAVSIARQCGIVPPAPPVVFIDTLTDQGRVQDTTVGFKAQDANGSPLLSGDGGEGRSFTAAELLTNVGLGAMAAAVTGRGFQGLTMATNDGGGLDTALYKGQVFARMSPDDKRALVEMLGDGTIGDTGEEILGLGHFVGFCGDGANDVGALKGAHVGVSLCEAEASIAAPLTSKQQTIACMLTVIAEGRCSLTTSYLIFKFIIVYAFIQVFAVAIMYSFGGSVGNFQYLIQDLLFTTVLAGVMGFTGPAKKLNKQRPPARLMSFGIWLPVLAQFLTVSVFQLAALGLLRSQSWYTQFDPTPDGQENRDTTCFTRTMVNTPRCSMSYENSTVFLLSLGQFLITALVFNKGPPHRQPLYTNVWLLLAIIMQTLFLMYLVLSPGGNGVTSTFSGLVPFPSSEFRWKLLMLLLMNLIVSWMVDQLSQWCFSKLRGRRVCGVTVM